MNSKKLYVRMIDDTLEIGLADSGLSESLADKAKLEKPKSYTMKFAPSTYAEMQKLKSLYDTTEGLLNALQKIIKHLDLTLKDNRKIARDLLIQHINATPDKFKVQGIEERKHTKTGETVLFLNYGLNYYLTQQPTSSYSVWLKNEGYVPTGRTYHSDYLDLDDVHASKNFVEESKTVVTDEIIEPIETGVTELTPEALEALVSTV